MEVRMRNEFDGRDRRRSARVAASGHVLIHGEEGSRGRIVDVSASGVRLRLAERSRRHWRGVHVELELRIDGATGGWWKLTGRIVRVDPGRVVVVAFDHLPTGFEDGIQVELVAALEGDAMPHVLLVDSLTWRRTQTAALLRATGRRVSEAATPLDAISHLGEARARVVAIADTVPSGIADELRAYVRTEHADLQLVRMIATAPGIVPDPVNHECGWMR